MYYMLYTLCNTYNRSSLYIYVLYMYYMLHAPLYIENRCLEILFYENKCL